MRAFAVLLLFISACGSAQTSGAQDHAATSCNWGSSCTADASCSCGNTCFQTCDTCAHECGVSCHSDADCAKQFGNATYGCAYLGTAGFTGRCTPR